MFAVDKGLSITLRLLSHFSMSVLRTKPVLKSEVLPEILLHDGQSNTSILIYHCRKERGTKSEHSQAVVAL